MSKTDLTNQRKVFVEEYVRSGDHLEAAKKAGYKDTHTLRNQACKLRRECAEEITEELHRNFAEIAPMALNILTDLPIGGSVWSWHQDYGYWYQNGCLFPDMASLFIPLEPWNIENGCLQIISKSHKLGRIDHVKLEGHDLAIDE